MLTTISSAAPVPTSILAQTPNPTAHATECNEWNTPQILPADSPLTHYQTSTSVTEQSDPRSRANVRQTAVNPQPTKHFRSRNNPRNNNAASIPSVASLPAKQAQAIDLMLAGRSSVEVAHLLNVNRSTVHRWRTGDSAFIAAYNRRHTQALNAISARVETLLDSALTELESALAGTPTSPRQITAATQIINAFASRRLRDSLIPADQTP